MMNIGAKIIFIMLGFFRLMVGRQVRLTMLKQQKALQTLRMKHFHWIWVAVMVLNMVTWLLTNFFIILLLSVVIKKTVVTSLPWLSWVILIMKCIMYQQVYNR